MGFISLNCLKGMRAFELLSPGLFYSQWRETDIFRADLNGPISGVNC